MRIAIFGVGAMGCLFGARLTSHADVTLVGHWPEQLDALRRAPLHIIHPDDPVEAQRAIPLHVTHDPGTIGLVDLALVLTKAAGTEQAADSAAQILRPDGLAITLQNGVGNLEIMAAHIGEDRTTLGVTTEGAATEGPGVLRYGGAGTTHLATRPEIAERLRAVAALFEGAGFTTHIVEDVSGLVWGKLAVNAGINPLTALLRVLNGALTESTWARGIMHEAAREVQAVAAAQGITLPYEDAAARTEEVAHLTARNRSSMLQDVSRGAKTEIETICGAVVRSGESRGVATPVNAMLYRLVKAVEEMR